MDWLGRREAKVETERVPGEQEADARQTGRLRTALYGLDGVGKQVVALLVRRSDVQIVAAVDADPLNVGKDLGEVAGLGHRLGIAVSYDPGLLVSGAKADVVMHATSPYLSVAWSQLLPLLASGKSTISACDELVYPWASHPDMASRLDATAKKAGAALVAVGPSAGVVSDSLSLFLASACAEVEALSVSRVIDLVREPTADRAAAALGMTVDAFREAADDGAVGFVALLDSVALMAARQGWRLDRFAETIEPIQATRRWETEAKIVERGRVAGLRQVARGYSGDAETVKVELVACLGATDPHDAIVVRGRPPISARIERSIPSHMATAALMVHVLHAVATARSGLISVADLLGTYVGRTESPPT